MAGTPHPIRRELSAEYLTSPVWWRTRWTRSPLGTTFGAAAACAICCSHLSRMAEEPVLWSTAEFRLIRMGGDYATGSSIMPQKRNPTPRSLAERKNAAGSTDS